MKSIFGRLALSSWYERVVFAMLGNLQEGVMQLHIEIDGRNECIWLGDPVKIAEVKTQRRSGKSKKKAKKATIDVAQMTIVDERFFKNIVFFGDIGFGEAYMSGYWHTADIAATIRWFLGNLQRVPTISGTKNRSLFFNVFKLINGFKHWRRKNFPQKAKINIREHYDLSNDFFKLFLDETMTYSSAWFPTQPTPAIKQEKKIKKEKPFPNFKKVKKIFGNDLSDLAMAQLAKYDRLCQIINLKEGDEVLEVGSGWGGFALYANQAYGARVRSITISKKQYNYAEAIRRKKNINKKEVSFEIVDYRHVRGSFDKMVSIEMIEAVGWQFLDQYFAAFQRLLRPNGMFALQAIMCPDSRFPQMKQNIDWIQKHIFPGSCLTSMKSVLDSLFRSGDFFLYDVKDMGQDYVETLSLWYTRFNQRLDDVRKLGYSETFIRKWNYYLKYCEAAFQTRNISVMQLAFGRPTQHVLQNNQRNIFNYTDAV